MSQKYMFEIRFGLFCLAATLFTLGTMAIYEVEIAGSHSPAGVLMTHPVMTLAVSAVLLIFLLIPPRWLDYQSNTPSL